MPVSVATAFQAALDLARPVAAVDLLPLAQAAGRVLAAGQQVAAAYPAYAHAAVDGYAVRAADCAGAAFVLACSQHILPGTAPAPLAAGTAARIFTGAALPPGADTVVMQEECEPVAAGAGVRLPPAPAAGANIRQAGEDMQPGQALFAAGTVLDARHLAAAAAADIGLLPVRRRVRVAFLSCGNELVQAGDKTAPPVAARDSNRPMLAALLARPWIEGSDLGIQRDQPDMLAAILTRAAASADLIITSGGMSVGDSDHLAAAMIAAGGEWKALQVRMKPGKPVGLGRLGGAAVLALPGNPYAAFVGAVLFGNLVLRRLSGQAAARPAGLPACFSGEVPPRGTRTQFLPVVLESRGPARSSVLRVLGPGGSARLFPLLAADGLGELPPAAGTRGGDADPVRFHPFGGLL